MQASRAENLPAPPGVISSIRAGFDTIAAHIAAILLPLALDLWLWLGPRLSMERLFAALQPQIMAIWEAGGVSTADIQQVMKWYETTIPGLNLFWILRTLPVGVSSLMFAQSVDRTPLGPVAIWQVTAQNLPGWIGLLLLAGWVGGGLYFRWVAQLSLKRSEQADVQTSRAVAQTILLSLVWSGMAFAIGLPVFIVVSLLYQFNAALAQIVILAASFLSMWLIVPLFFWPHGVFVRKQNALLSIIGSIQMARFTLPSSSFFVLSVFLLGMGLNYLWKTAPSESWMTLVGILGHAFITTALLAASFIYYRDMSAWLQSVIERLRANSTAPKQVS
jgi:hypothetical protein